MSGASVMPGAQTGWGRERMLRSYLLWGLAALVIGALTGVAFYWYFVERGTHGNAASVEMAVAAASATPTLDARQAQARGVADISFRIQFCESGIEFIDSVLMKVDPGSSVMVSAMQLQADTELEGIALIEQSELGPSEKGGLTERLHSACKVPDELLGRAADAYITRQFGELPPDLAALLQPLVRVLLLTPSHQTLEQAQAKQEVIRTFLLWKAAQPQPVITRYIGGRSNEWRIDRLESRIRSICLEVDCY
jgi:hypothetical protein